jgi:hypothetical protein
MDLCPITPDEPSVRGSDRTARPAALAFFDARPCSHLHRVQDPGGEGSTPSDRRP